MEQQTNGEIHCTYNHINIGNEWISNAQYRKMKEITMQPCPNSSHRTPNLMSNTKKAERNSCLHLFS